MRTSFYALAVLFLVGSVCSDVVADDRMGKDETYLKWNQVADKAQCPEEETFLWVKHAAGEDCVRYFAGAPLYDVSVAVVMMYGDRDRVMRRPISMIKSNTADAQRAIAQKASEAVGIPVIVLARPGTYGSTGDHSARRTVREFAPLNAALDALKQRYRIERFALFGHSGGATAAAALLSFGRTDVRCAVLTSGAFNFKERARIWAVSDGRPLRAFPADSYDPIDHVDGIREDPNRSIYILGSPRDNVTPWGLQRDYALAVRDAGHWVIFNEVAGVPPSYHNLKGNVALEAIEHCAK